MFGFKRSDNQIQQDVASEILWDARVTSPSVSVSVKNRVVTLRGSVPHYFEKSAAEEAAHRVSGVVAVADELEVKIVGPYETSDEDIAVAAVAALEQSYTTPKRTAVTVDHGLVTLSGEADWYFQRTAARDVVSSLMGVKGVINLIDLTPKEKPSDVRKLIEKALQRSAASNTQTVHVTVDGSTVTLSGTIRSFAEGADARTAAWNTPGVNKVTDKMVLQQGQ